MCLPSLWNYAGTSAAPSAAAATATTAVLPMAVGQQTNASSTSNLSTGELVHSVDSWLVRCSVAPTSDLRDLASSDASLRNLELVPLVCRTLIHAFERVL